MAIMRNTYTRTPDEHTAIIGYETRPNDNGDGDDLIAHKKNYSEWLDLVHKSLSHGGTDKIMHDHSYQHENHDGNGGWHFHNYLHEGDSHTGGHDIENQDPDHRHETTPRRPVTTPDPQPSTGGSNNDGGEEGPTNPESDSPTTPRSRTRSSDITPDMTRSEVSDTVERSLQIAVETQEDMPDEIPESTEEMEEEEVIPLVYFGTQWYKGYNLVSFPVLPTDIVTISDFYHRWSFFNSPQDSIIVSMDGWWLAYNGEDNAVGDLEITPYLGVAMLHDWSVYLGIHGVPVIGDGVLELEAGHHLVGLSEIPEGFTKPSDFLDVPGIYWVVTRTTADVVEIPEWHSIGREGDPGDEHSLYLGQAVLLVVEQTTQIVFREDVSAAPQAQRRGTLAVGWGAMKNQ